MNLLKTKIIPFNNYNFRNKSNGDSVLNMKSQKSEIIISSSCADDWMHVGRLREAADRGDLEAEKEWQRLMDEDGPMLTAEELLEYRRKNP